MSTHSFCPSMVFGLFAAWANLVTFDWCFRRHGQAKHISRKRAGVAATVGIAIGVAIVVAGALVAVVGPQGLSLAGGVGRTEPDQIDRALSWPESHRDGQGHCRGG
jgi:hypothetical protein